MSDIPIIEKAIELLGEKHFEKARELFTNIINEDPSCAEAYLGRALADLGLTSEDKLASTAFDLSANDDLNKAIALSDDKRRQALEELIREGESRRDIVSLYDEDILERIYIRAINCEETSEGYEKAASTLRSIGPYRDASQLAKRYDELSCELKKSEILAEEKRKENETRILNEKKKKSDSVQIKIYTVAIIVLSLFIVFLLCYNLFLKEHFKKQDVLDLIYPLTYKDVTVAESDDMPYFSVSSQGELSFHPDEYSGNGVIVIPDVFDNTLVTSIEEYAFKDCTDIKSVTVSNFVTDMGNGVFNGCSFLTEVTLPKNLAEIAPYTFKNCTSLNKVVFPELLEAIGDQAFSGCKSITEVLLPETVALISAHAFDACSSLKRLYLPISLRKIEQGAFRYCSSLVEVTYAGSKQEYEDRVTRYTDSKAFDVQNVIFSKNSNT